MTFWSAKSTDKTYFVHASNHYAWIFHTATVLFTWKKLGKFLHLENVSKFYKGDHQVNFTCGYTFLFLANLR